MKIFQVTYRTEKKEVNRGYVVCESFNNIKTILSEREDEDEEDIEITFCRGISIEQVYIKDLTIADFLRLTK